MEIESTITIGNILTILSIVVSVIALTYGWRKDRALKRMNYADRIRQAAVSTVIKLERWRELTLQIFEDMQPILSEIDRKVADGVDFVQARDSLWINLWKAHSDISHRILNEQIETAYSDLYAYDSKIKELYTGIIGALHTLDRRVFGFVLERTQDVILNLINEKAPVESSVVGNCLRNACERLAAESAQVIDQIITGYRQEMMKIIEANDDEIINKKISINDCDTFTLSFKGYAEESPWKPSKCIVPFGPGWPGTETKEKGLIEARSCKYNFDEDKL